MHGSVHPIFVLMFMVAATDGVLAQERPVVTLQRTACFGTCPVYSLEIFENGFIKFVGKQFVQAPGEHRTVISQDEVDNLISTFLKADYFAMRDSYETCVDAKGVVWQVSDLPTEYSSLRVGERKKSIRDYACAPRELMELELEVDRVANTHRWIDGDKDDLKQWEFVQPDVYRRIKPGMNELMQAAGEGDLQRLDREHGTGVNIDHSDETGWTALILAAAMCREKAVQKLLDWGANANLRDKNGDTALIGAAAAFCTSDESRESQARIVQLLALRGAGVNTHNAAGETALMAVTTYGNLDALRALLKSGARPELKDNTNRSALDYAHSALKKYNDRFWTSDLREIVKILEARR